MNHDHRDGVGGNNPIPILLDSAPNLSLGARISKGILQRPFLFQFCGINLISIKKRHPE